uniref:UspA domain-containing protein n=1 Tax=Oscillatoriales cyanobacterium SpSt-402 TaxID=2282168 RepID=A0A832H5B9_9CYAN
MEVIVQQSENIPRAIATTAQSYDLVILQVSPRHFTSVGLPLSDLTTQTVEQLTCSVIMLGSRPNRSFTVENNPLLSQSINTVTNHQN